MPNVALQLAFGNILVRTRVDICTFVCDVVFMQDMRTRRPTNLTLDPEILAELDEWIEKRSEEHTSELPVTLESRMPSSA